MTLLIHELRQALRSPASQPGSSASVAGVLAASVAWVIFTFAMVDGAS
ncbi:MAG: hypothetical protein P4L92_21850 [Rudaea sp.]|nr:hypothetical protein [Rudaea sp.]